MPLKQFTKMGWFGDQTPGVFQFVATTKDNYYIGLPYLHDIIELDAGKKEISRHPFRFNKIKTIKPLSSTYRRMPNDLQKMHVATYGSYFEFIYDPYQYKFIRKVIAPNPGINNIDEAYHNQYLLVADQKFSPLHELKIPPKYQKGLPIWFTSPFGLCLCDREAYSKDENNLVFDCYKF